MAFDLQSGERTVYLADAVDPRRRWPHPASGDEALRGVTKTPATALPWPCEPARPWLEYGAGAVPPHRHGDARGNVRHPGDRSGARRRRPPLQQSGASATWSAMTRSVWSCRHADRVALANYTEIVEGRRRAPTAGVFLDITHRDKNYILQKLPRMYRQFMESQMLDISRQPMEVGADRALLHGRGGGRSGDPCHGRRRAVCGRAR